MPLKSKIKLMAHGLSLIFIFILMIYSVSATGNYTYNNHNQGIMENGVFGSADDCSVNPSLCASRPMTSPSLSPYVSDLDGDGINEIIVVDSTSIKLYHGSSLDIVDSYNGYGTIIGLYIYDIDNDTKNEIIIENTTTNFYDIEWNGTSFNKDALSIFKGSYEKEFQYACESANKCVLVYHYGQGWDCGGSGLNQYDLYLYATPFNSNGTANMQNTTLFSYDTGLACYSSYAKFCRPLIPSIDVKDTDKDGTPEYVFTVMLSSYLISYNTDKIYIYLLSYLNTTTIFNEGSDSRTIYDTAVNSNSCTDSERKLITSPLAYNFDGMSGNGKELVYGYQDTLTTFKLRSTNGGFGDVITYPSLSTAEGHLISNIVRAEVFPDTAGRDSFCVLGADTSADDLALMCGNMVSSAINNEWIFYLSHNGEYDADGGKTTYNLSSSISVYTNLITSSQQSSESVSFQDYFVAKSGNPDEFSSSYGILQIKGVTAPLGYGGMDLDYTQTHTNASVIMSDATTKGLSDMIALTSTNLWYISDGYVVPYPYINDVLMCPTGVIKQNTTVEVSVIPKDNGGNQVRTKILSYYGTSDEQDSGWSGYYVSGTTIPLTFFANVTTSSATMKVYVQNSYYNDSYNVTLNIPYSVAYSGAEIGDACYHYINTTPGGSNASTFTDESGTTITNNSITTGLNSLDSSFNLGIGVKAIFFLIMVGLMILIWWLGAKSGWESWIILIMETAIFMMGNLFGFFVHILGWGTLIIYIGLIIIGVGFAIRPFILGDR